MAGASAGCSLLHSEAPQVMPVVGYTADAAERAGRTPRAEAAAHRLLEKIRRIRRNIYLLYVCERLADITRRKIRLQKLSNAALVRHYRVRLGRRRAQRHVVLRAPEASAAVSAMRPCTFTPPKAPGVPRPAASCLPALGVGKANRRNKGAAFTSPPLQLGSPSSSAVTDGFVPSITEPHVAP